MKKTFLLTILAVLALAVNAQQFAVQPAQKATMQKAPAAELMEFGYCGEMETYLGLESELSYRILMEIPADRAAKFEGSQIKKVSFGLGSLTGNSAKVIILNSLQDATPAYTQNTTVQAETWNEVTLTTPYTVGKDAFYIGYEVDATEEDYPIGVDEGTANPCGDIVGYYYQGAWQFMHLGEQGFGNNCIKIYLEGDALPQYDFALQALNTKEVVKPGTEFTLGATVKNMGQKNVSSFDVTYQINNEAPVTKTINKAVNAGQVLTFDITTLKFDQEGTYSVTVTVDNLDGNADQDASDNTLSKSTIATNDFIARKVLLEQFSTQNCGNCPPVHAFIKEIVNSRNDIAWVIHHAGFYTDEYTIEESANYEWFFGNGGTYAPAAMLDRTNLNAQGSESGSKTPVFFPSSKTMVTSLMDYCADQPAYAEVVINDTYNPETREYYVKVSGKSIIDFNREVYVHIFLTENGLKGTQSGGGNNYDHSHAMRKVMTSCWGDEVSFTNNNYEVEYKCTLDSKWVPENMNVIAFLAYNSDTDVNDCQVLNTEFKKIATDMSAVKGVNNDQNNVWAVGNDICINGAYNTAAVYTVDGRLVATANNAANVKVENNGLYVVVVDGVSYKVVVK